MLATQELACSKDECGPDVDVGWMCEHTKSDKIRNVVTGEKVGVPFVADR